MADTVEIVGGKSLVRGIPLSQETCLGPLTLGGYVKEIAARFGPREAAVMRLGDQVERWTYDDLLAKSMEVARALIASGVGKGTRVGVLATNRLEFLSGMFGATLAGGVATCLSTFSTPAELEYLVQSSACSVLLLERKVLKKDFAQIMIDLEPAIGTAKPSEVVSTKFPYLTHLAIIDGEEGLGAIEGWSTFLARGKNFSDAQVDARAACVTPADPGVLLYSSGSTGKPKGVLNGHRGVCLQLWRFAKWFATEADVRSWSANGFFWSGNFCQALGSTLSVGGSLVLQRFFDAPEALSLMEQEQVNMVIAWPHQWAQLEGAPNWATADLSSLKYIDKDSPLGKHPTVKSSYREPTAYGNTETFTFSTVYEANTTDDERRGSFGKVVSGATIKIIDVETGEIVPIGERGEIAVKCATLMMGYVGTSLDETTDADGYLRTGDGGYFDNEGRLFWEGRLNDIIKTGGANVSPVEIDGVIATMPGVKVTKTVGVPDELLGELVVACIVPHDDVKLSEDGVRNFVKEQLASYKVPRRVLFFSEEDLSLTGSNKVKASDIKALAIKRLEAETA